MKKALLLIQLFGLGLLNCFGQLSINAAVSYKTKDGSYSEPYIRKVQIETGSRLNKKVGSADYDANSDYILVWFSQNEVAIIKTNIIFCPGNSRIMNEQISKTCFDLHCRFKGYTVKGTDQDGDEWRFCFNDLFPNSCY